MREQVSPSGELAWMGLLDVDRVAAMREFLMSWYAGLRPGRAEAGVPVALAELYALADGRPEVLGTQNRVYPLAELRTDPHEGLLVFGGENQGNFTWMIDPAEPDPVVWTVPDLAAPVAEGEPLSGFLVQFCLFEAIMSAPHAVICWPLSREQAGEVTAVLTEVPLAPWGWPGDPARLFAGPDVVLCVSEHDGEFEAVAGARSAEALSPLTDVGLPWEPFGP